jgi:nucleotide-binding universal stress UspA family protein
MKFLVGYNSSPSSRRALSLACEHAKLVDAMVYVATSLAGGQTETTKDIQTAEEQLAAVKTFMDKMGVQYETFQLARGLSPGEDIVKFAEDNAIDHVFLGVEKRSRTSKIILGSTAQYVILKGPCPVTTTK